MRVQIESAVLDEIRTRLRAMDPNANVRPKMFEPAFHEFLSRHAVTLRAPKTVRYQLSVLRPYFKHQHVHEIGLTDVQAFISKMIEKGKKPATINRHRSALGKFVGWSIEQGYAASNPVYKVKRLTENNARTRDLTPDEYDRLVAACRGKRQHLRPVIVAAVHLGARRRELLSLKWSDLDLARGFVRFRANTTKSARERVVPLVPELIDLFQDMHAAALAGDGDREHVFTFRGQRITCVKKAFTTACHDAGIENLHLHDLRHAFAGNYVSNGGSLYALQSLLGHSDARMTQRYARIAPEFLASTSQHIGIPGRPRAIPPKVEPPKPQEAPPIPADTVQVLRDIRDLFQARRVTWLGTEEILNALSAMPRWAVLIGPKMHTCRVLAGLLRPVGVKPGQCGQAQDVNRKGYKIVSLAPAWARYLDTEGGA